MGPVGKILVEAFILKTYNFLQPLAIYKLRAPIIAVVLFIFSLGDIYLVVENTLPASPFSASSLSSLTLHVCMYVCVLIHTQL